MTRTVGFAIASVVLALAAGIGFGWAMNSSPAHDAGTGTCGDSYPSKLDFSGGALTGQRSDLTLGGLVPAH